MEMEGNKHKGTVPSPFTSLSGTRKCCVWGNKPYPHVVLSITNTTTTKTQQLKQQQHKDMVYFQEQHVCRRSVIEERLLQRVRGGPAEPGGPLPQQLPGGVPVDPEKRAEVGEGAGPGFLWCLNVVKAAWGMFEITVGTWFSFKPPLGQSFEDPETGQPFGTCPN